MRIRVLCIIFCVWCALTATAQDIVAVYPTPQEMTLGDQKLTLPLVYQLVKGEKVNDPIVELLEEVLGKKQQKNAKFQVVIGKRGDKAVRKYTRMIPQRPEGYYLLVNDRCIVLAGNDDRGTYYAIQTLSQLIQNGALLTAEIKDYPTVRFRGVVEGFYGTPWSHEARLRQLQFYGEQKMNTYIYGPKDDPYHSCPNWREPYPANEAVQISELVKAARENAVDFVWAIHPGQDIKWNEEDRKLLLNKFESMYQLGVRAFAVFFDDISGEGTDPVRQAELLNYIDDQFVKVKGDVNPLIMCPTEYNKSWSNPARGYLVTLGTKLNPSVQIMWTGDRVISDITEAGLIWVNEKIKRPAYIWWNFPVSDYVRDHLLMGAVYGLDLSIGNEMSGFVTNPMEHAEASKIAIFSVADYAWNPKKFNGDASWKAAVKAVLPGNAKALQVFVNHNSDLGANGHGYRREESVEIQPVVARFLNSYRQGKYSADDFRVLSDEFAQMTEVADLLLADTEGKALVNELTPWLYQFKLLGESGTEALTMVKAIESGNQVLALRKYWHLKALQKRSFDIDQKYNQNPYQPGIKTGSKVMQPFVDTVFVLATQSLNQKAGSSLSSEIFTSPHKSYSTVAQCKTLLVRIKANRVVMSPMLEVIKWGAGQYLGVELDKEYVLQALEADFGVKTTMDWLQFEISTDGRNWQSVPLNQKANQIKASMSNKARFVRIVNKSDKEQEVYLRKFIIMQGN